MAGSLSLLAFRLRGSLAHFRQPDTTVTQATYPFPGRPTLLGLIGSILGVEDGDEWVQFLALPHWLGLQLLAPVQTVLVQMSLLGKGFLGASGDDFNRPTTLELVVKPDYLVYYTGPVLEKLLRQLTEGRSVFHTYLGSAFCLTHPEFCGNLDVTPMEGKRAEKLPVASVIPTDAVERVILAAGSTYATARAMPYIHRGDRTFTGNRSFHYERSGNPLYIQWKSEPLQATQIVRLSTGSYVCLW
jgi:CRISPR-associated protein Cas5h